MSVESPTGFDNFSLRRLGIRRGQRVLVFNPPGGYREAIQDGAPKSTKVVDLSQLDGQIAEIVLIWPETLGLFEQALRDLRGHVANDAAVWVIMGIEGTGLLDRSVPRQDIVRSASTLEYVDVGVRNLGHASMALKLVPDHARNA
jgi:hypothetical protein